ncbi:hypothetical protein GGI11_001647 [Coemansia sp. RSA 2049]|nr:hypothetical protein GGI11_001647 [Coemansia sp. RSA 2049]
MCDTDGTVWNSALFAHLYLFYLSKYYELVDTVIIILKGRKASLLQIYHHAGVILVMHTANYYTSPCSVFIIWENAGVHTIMYTYYALTALGFNPPGKQYLTSLQIFQFLFGQAVVLVYFSIPGCLQPAQRTWPLILTAYLLPLIYLFAQFFRKTYKPPAGTHVKLSSVPLGEWYPFFMQWQVAVFISVAYTVLSFYFNPKTSKLSRVEAKRQKVGTGDPSLKKKALTPMTMFVVFHNTVLAVYSAWAFRSVFPLFVSNMLKKGFSEGMCDTDGTVWNSALFAHLYLFYLSKYYELVDTVIIILKGRKASLLQIYHHAGVILITYATNYFASSSGLFLVWENTGVHTIMYTYYALTALGFNPPGKQYLTSLQIFQFLFGQVVLVVYLVIPGCQTQNQNKAQWIMTAYLVPLIYLFAQFFKNTYKRSTLSKKDK